MSKLHRDNAGYVGCSYEETQDPYYSYNKLSLPLNESDKTVVRDEVTFTVTVAGGKFVIDGTSQATVSLLEGNVYTFDQSDASNAGGGTHPLKFSYTADGTHGGGQEYTLGVTTNGTPGQSGAYTRIVVPFGLHDLKYYCGNHSGMGGSANVVKNTKAFTVGRPILKTTDAFGKTLGSGNNADPYAANLVLAVPMNGANNGTTFTDVSNVISGTGSAVSITRTGAVTKTDQSYFYGSSGYFNGSSYLELGSLSSSSIKDFTFESWVRPDGTNQYGFFSNQGSDNAANTMRIGTGSGGGIWMKIAGSSLTTANGTVPANVWTHVAVVRKGTLVTCFLNGRPASTMLIGETISPTSFNVGRTYTSGNTFPLTGYMQDVRFYDYAKYTTPFSTASYGMDVVRYTGNSGTQTISGLNFKPDLVWVKCLTLGHNHRLSDVLRGTNNTLATDVSNTPRTNSGQLTSFNSDGFSLGSDAEANNNNQNYIAWTWKAGGAPTTDNLAAAGNVPTAGSVKVDGADLTTALAGSIQVTRLTASTEYGFSIIDYQGDGTAGDTLGHALGADPKFLIIKNRTDAENWFVWHHSYPIPARNGFYIDLEANIQNFGLGSFNDVLPSSSVITLGTNNILNSTNDSYSAYCWAEKPGFSKFGKFTHSGAASSESLGFRPAFVLIKNLNVNNTNWYIFDNRRDTNNAIFPNVDGTENSGWAVTFNDDGFAWAGGSFNNGDLIYAAFAESASGDAAFESILVDQLGTDDLSGNDNNASNVGATWQTSVKKFYDGAVEFDGSGGHLVIPNDASLQFGAGDFTIEGWFYSHSAPSTYPTLISKYDNSDASWIIRLSTTNQIIWYDGNNTASAANVFSYNSWNHFAAVRSGGTVVMYLNGSPVLSRAYDFNFDDTNKIHIARQDQNNTSNWFDGSIQDIRIYKGIAKYTSSFSPPERSVQGTARRYPSGVYVVS